MNESQAGRPRGKDFEPDQCSKTASETPRDVDPIFIGAGSSSESLKKKSGFTSVTYITPISRRGFMVDLLALLLNWGSNAHITGPP